MDSVQPDTAALRVLVIDRKADAHGMAFALEEAGMRCAVAFTAMQARALAVSFVPDVALIALDLPEGRLLLRWLLDGAECGVIALGTPDDSTDGVAALELGADDAVARPPGMREVAARIRAVHRRLQARPVPQPMSDVTVGPIRIHTARRAVTDEGGRRIPLTSAEFALLDQLAQAHGRAVSRDTLSEAALRRPWRPEDRSVDQLVFSLRQKLPPDDMGSTLIHSVRGAGYVLRAPDRV